MLSPFEWWCRNFILPDICKPCLFVFLRNLFYLTFDPDSFRHTHEKILKAIGTEHIRFHDLRHTFATLSLKNGVDVKTLSSTLGHYSAGFTLSTYTHATPDMMREAADTMGDVIGKAI